MFTTLMPELQLQVIKGCKGNTPAMAQVIYKNSNGKELILMFKRVSSARAKANSDRQPIAPTSSLTIGNTLVLVAQLTIF